MNPKNIKAYGTEAADAPIKPMNINRREVQPNDVEIEILYCGVCHSDLHMARNDWNNAVYPVVPGHEIIGKVIQVGEKVSRFKIGDFAAVGVMVDSCHQCDSCNNGQEQYCLNGFTGTYNGKDKYLGTRTFGGYSETIVVDEHFVLNQPENLDLAGTAPLLCAGITTWSPLRHWKVGKGSKVAVIGLGGLGHMAIKFANALGAHVTLLSRSPHKTEDAMKLGAHQVVISTDDKQMEESKGKFDLIIDTVPYDHDVNLYMPTLAISGTLVVVGYLGKIENMLNTVPMITGRRSVAGSVIGGIAETQEMLNFCAEHNITADVEVIKMQEINEAYERMLKSDVRYRFVIDMKTINPG
ncbi:MAG: NAD(P)-dependent alcohol dehydrogenase [Cyclobacteriaceae bacterium]|nr:NAD(P)-dependent alcohol dehydrogenase [Cyclobacteriaceae bacterium]